MERHARVRGANGKIALISILFAGSILTGCGSDKASPPSAKTTDAPAVDASYKQRLTAVDDGLDAAMGALFADQQMTPVEVQDAKAALASAREELRQLDAPDDVREAHQLYLEGVEEFDPVIAGLAAAKGDREKIQAHLADPAYAAAIGKLERSKQQFEDQGYEF